MVDRLQEALLSRRGAQQISAQIKTLQAAAEERKGADAKLRAEIKGFEVQQFFNSGFKVWRFQ